MLPTFLHIRLLGEFRLIYGDKAVTMVNTGRMQALFGYLVLHRGMPQSRVGLASLLWPDSTEDQARTNLRNLLHRLRRAWHDCDVFISDDGGALEWRQTVLFTLDVDDFRQALTEMEQAERLDNTLARRRILESAVGLYRGELLPGCFDEWVLPERERLNEMFAAALEQLVVLLGNQGDYNTAIGYAQRLMKHDPLHEVTYRHLMRLYAMSGDQSSGLRVYRTAARTLLRELGVEPSAVTRKLYEQLLRHEKPSPQGMEKPVEGLSQALLPTPSVRVDHCQHEIAEIQALLKSHRTVTLVGRAASGTFRRVRAMVEQRASEYTHGVCWLDFTGVGWGNMAQFIGVTSTDLREDVQRELMNALVNAVASKQLLLVLDNCEHMVEVCRSLAGRLLAAAPEVHLLLTSREPLSFAGEVVWIDPSE